VAEGVVDPPQDQLNDAVLVTDSRVHGRGVFARRFIAAGERFCVNPLFRIPSRERRFLDQTALYDHYFEYNDDAFIALGPITFLNHQEQPNADFELDSEELQITLRAVNAIAPGEEISIHYGTEPWW
jgi:SET domain-containing protein